MAKRSDTPTAERDGRICVGVITARHGVRGAVRVKTFTDEPRAIENMSGLTYSDGRAVSLRILEVKKSVVIAKVDGIDTANAAEAAAGTHLFIAREALPDLDADEYYHADLIGLRVERIDGEAMGTVDAVYDFGAGDLIDVRLDNGQTVTLPFRAETVPVVDLAGGRLVVDPPPGLLEDGS